MYLGFGSSRLLSVTELGIQFTLVLYSSALIQELSIRAQFTFVFLIRLPISVQLRHKAPAGAVILGHLRRSVKVTDQTVYIATTTTTTRKLGLR